MQGARKGFTLIELITVVAIIGILATIVTISVMSARVKGRDAQRLAALQQIRAALDQYAVENGHYPSTSSDNTTANIQWTSFDPTNVYYTNFVYNPSATNIKAALQPYLGNAQLIDPSGQAGSGNDAGYLYISNGTDYMLFSWRRPEDMRDFDPAMINTVPGRCNGTPINGQCPGTNTVGFWTNGAMSW